MRKIADFFCVKIKEIKKGVIFITPSMLIIAICSGEFQAEAFFFSPQAPVSRQMPQMKPVDKTTGQSGTIGSQQSGQFLSQEATVMVPTNLTHDPARPNTFKERGMPQAPTMEQLYDILLRKGDQGYEHYVNQWVDRYGEEARLTDQKLSLIWREAERIDLDPFYFLAILAQEGTGSFDTLPSPEGGQRHPDFEADVIRAADVIIREITEWKQSGCRGDWLRWVNYGNGGDVYAGGYAEDPNWWKSVIDIYEWKRLQVK